MGRLVWDGVVWDGLVWGGVVWDGWIDERSVGWLVHSFIHSFCLFVRSIDRSFIHLFIRSFIH